MITVKLTLPDGTTKNHRQKHGHWEYIWQEGEKYVGEYKDGQQHGQGSFIYPDGQIYVGEVIGGSFDGSGFAFNTDTQINYCIYKSNKASNCVDTNAYDVAVNLKKQFAASSISKRKMIQSNLKEKGLYTSSIDGEWGRGTLLALVQFASRNLQTVNLQSASMSKKLLDAVLQ